MGPPTVVSDRFELERLVGAGGMGSVYRAWDREEGRTVAVKLVKDAADHARFEREAAVLEALDHPGIVHYVAHGKTPDGGAFLAMEWVEGESVAALLDREQQLPADDAVLLCHRIARALAAAHAEGIVHRDLKPANVLLADGAIDRPKIVDFGIARGAAASGATDLTGTSELIGTPGYMPPEQMRAGGRAVPASDVYGLGCILFRAIAGRRPFEAATTIEVLQLAANQDAPRLASIVDGVPAALDELVARMLARDAAQRPGDGAAAAERLAAFIGPAAGPSERGRARVEKIESRPEIAASPDLPGDAEAARARTPILVAVAVLSAVALAFLVFRLAAGGGSATGASSATSSPTAAGEAAATGPCTLDGIAYATCTDLPADFPTDLVLAITPLAARAKELEPTSVLTHIPWTAVSEGAFDPSADPAELFQFRYRKADGQVGEIHFAIHDGALMMRRAPTVGGNVALQAPPCSAGDLLRRAREAGLPSGGAVEMAYEGLRGGGAWRVRSGGQVVTFSGADCSVLYEGARSK